MQLCVCSRAHVRVCVCACMCVCVWCECMCKCVSVSIQNWHSHSNRQRDAAGDRAAVATACRAQNSELFATHQRHGAPHTRRACLGARTAIRLPSCNACVPHAHLLCSAVCCSEHRRVSSLHACQRISFAETHTWRRRGGGRPTRLSRAWARDCKGWRWFGMGMGG